MQNENNALNPFMYVVRRPYDDMSVLWVFECNENRFSLSTHTGTGDPVKLLMKVKAKAPWMDRIVDVSARDVLISLASKKGSSIKDVYLCSLSGYSDKAFDRVKSVYNGRSSDRNVYAEYLQCLRLPVSQGGPRKITDHDVSILRWETDKNKSWRHFANHPVFRIIKQIIFQTKRVKGTAAAYDAKEVEKAMLTLCCDIFSCMLRPFPIDIDTSLFSMQVYMDDKSTTADKSKMYDKVYAATREPVRCFDGKPDKNNIIWSASKLLDLLQVQMCPVFSFSKTPGDHDVVIKFLEILFASWSVSFYEDKSRISRLVDWGIMAPDIRDSFQKFVMEL